MAARSNAVLTEPAERAIIIERIFDAPRELVFKCWTEPEHLVRWIGPKGFSGTILTCELLPRNRSARADCPDVLLDGRRRQADAARDLADGDVCGPRWQDAADAASGCLRVRHRVR